MLDSPGFVQIEMVNARERKSFDPLSGLVVSRELEWAPGRFCPMPLSVLHAAVQP
jgi:hypothetical protein